MREETKNIFSASEVGVLIEDFKGQVKVVAEGVLSLDQKLDRSTKDSQERFSAIDNGIISLDNKIDRVAAELKDFIKSEIKTLRIEIKSIQETKVEMARVETLEQRIAAIKRLIGKQAN